MRQSLAKRSHPQGAGRIAENRERRRRDGERRREFGAVGRKQVQSGGPRARPQGSCAVFGNRHDEIVEQRTGVVGIMPEVGECLGGGIEQRQAPALRAQPQTAATVIEQRPDRAWRQPGCIGRIVVIFGNDMFFVVQLVQTAFSACPYAAVLVGKHLEYVDTRQSSPVIADPQTT